MTEKITTCQICGRPTKSKNGVIAHHGYTRPDSGWQTKSCFGARHLPYEISCDILPIAIKKISDYLEFIERDYQNFLNNPPEKMTIKNWRTKQDMELLKPESFTKDFRPTYMPESYDTEFFNRKYQFEQQIKKTQYDLIFMQNRLNNWKPLKEEN